MKPLIAIVGRPNVGKSTLFNRLIGKRLAVIASEAGTTRDRIYQSMEIDDYEVTLVDTGGLEYGKKDSIEADIQAQAELAIEEADIIYFVVDASDPLTADDYSAATILRKSDKKSILIANKCDSIEAEERVIELYKLGFGDPVEVSAIHNSGIDDLKKRTTNLLSSVGIKPKTETKKSTHTDEAIKLCFLGKPNVGKSSLVNALVGKKQVIVSDTPGTTRDATNTHITYNDAPFTLIDTAGLKRRGKIKKGIEKFSSIRCLNALERSDVALLVIDFGESFSKQDMHIAQFIQEAKKGVIIILNKIDLAENQKQLDSYIAMLQRKLVFLPWAPLIMTSAVNKKNITKIFEIAQSIMEQRNKRIPTARLNSFIKKIVYKHVPTGTKRIRPKILYVTQSDVNPPEFVLFVNDARAFHFSYRRYVENELRKEFGFDGTAVKIVYRSRKE